MSRMLMIVVALLALAACLPAQEGDPGMDVWVAASYPSTIEGCLERSGLDYLVMGYDGQVYNLTGPSKVVRPFVGREVEVTGRPTVISFDTTAEQMASSVEEIPALEVKTAKELSPSCDFTPR